MAGLGKGLIVAGKGLGILSILVAGGVGGFLGFSAGGGFGAGAGVAAGLLFGGVTNALSVQIFGRIGTWMIQSSGLETADQIRDRKNDLNEWTFGAFKLIGTMLKEMH